MSEARKRLAAFVALKNNSVPGPVPDGPIVTLRFDRIAGDGDLTLGHLRTIAAERDEVLAYRLDCLAKAEELERLADNLVTRALLLRAEGRKQ